MVNKIIVTEIPPTVTIYNNNERSRRHNSHTTPTLPNSAGSLTSNTNSNANTTAAGTSLDYVYSDSSEESSDGISANKENGVHPDWDRYYRELVDGSLQCNSSDVFLKRNLKLMSEELGANVMTDTMSINQLMCCIDTRTFRPHYIANTEDLFWRKRTEPCRARRQIQVECGDEEVNMGKNTEKKSVLFL